MLNRQREAAEGNRQGLLEMPIVGVVDNTVAVVIECRIVGVQG
jgi:hypothetical protein